jgi:putative addiction module antidote
MAEGESAAVIGPTRLPASREASSYRCNRCEPERLVEPSTTPSSSLSIPVSRFISAWGFSLVCYNRRGNIIIMVIELKLRKIGNSLGVVLPKEALAKLGAQEGDSLMLSDGNDDSLRISANKPAVSRQMEIAQSLMERYRNTLRELAK